MSTPLDRIHDAASTVVHSARTLEDLAGALKRVGLDDLSYEICGIASDLEAAAEDVRQAYTQEINGQVGRSEQATANMVGAALAAVAKRSI